MKLSRVRVDLAKNVYQLHGVDRHGKTVWKRPLGPLKSPSLPGPQRLNSDDPGELSFWYPQAALS